MTTSFPNMSSLVGNMYQYRFALVVLVCVCLAALLCLVVYLLSAAGHRPDRQGIALNPFDKLPGDLYLAAVIGGVTLLAMLFRRSFYWEGWITLVTGIACLLAAGILVTAFLMSLATRVKYGQGYWWRRSVVGFCLVLLLRACRFVVRGARSLFGMLPTIWKWLLIGGSLDLHPGLPESLHHGAGGPGDGVPVGVSHRLSRLVLRPAPQGRPADGRGEVSGEGAPGPSPRLLPPDCPGFKRPGPGGQPGRGAAAAVGADEDRAHHQRLPRHQNAPDLHCELRGPAAKPHTPRRGSNTWRCWPGSPSG